MSNRVGLTFFFQVCLALILSFGIMWANAFWATSSAHRGSPSVQLESVDLGNNTTFQVSVENGGICGENGCQIAMSWTNTLPDRRETAYNTWGKIRVHLSNDSGYEKSEMLLGSGERKIKVNGELANQGDVDMVYSNDKMTFGPYEVKFLAFYIYGKKPSFFTNREQSGRYFVLPEKGKYKLEIFLVDDDKSRLLAQYPNIVVQ